MIQFVTYSAFTVIMWVLSVRVSEGQKLEYLNVNTQKLQQARKLEQYALRTHDSLRLAQAWFQLGEAYEFVGDNQRAEPYYLKALRILEPRGGSYELVKLYVGLSELEQRQHHFEESLAYATAALQVAQRIQSTKGLIVAYRMLGHIRHFVWNDGKRTKAGYDSVVYYFRQSEQLSARLKDTLHMAEANAFLGAFYMENNRSQAIYCLKKALYLFNLKDDVEWEIRVLIHLSRIYQNMGNLPLAWRRLQQANELYTTRHVNEHGVRAMLESKFLDYFRATQQWKKALDHAETLQELEKQQLLADRNGAISQLNVAYETKKKEELLKTQRAELALRDENLRTQERFTRFYVALCLIIAGVSIIFFKLYRKNQRISRRNEELLKEQNHRVKNNLQVVSSLLSLQSRQLTDEAAKKAVEETRLRIQSMVILHQKLYFGDAVTEINSEEFIRELADGVLKAFGYSFIQIHYCLDEINLPADKAILVGLIVNELVTNACKHAFPRNETPSLRISCYQKANKITLKVADNGPGLEGPGLDGPGLDGPGPVDTRMDRLYDGFPLSQRGAFGMQLIRAQVRQLKGVCWFDVNWHPPLKGTQFTLEFNK